MSRRRSLLAAGGHRVLGVAFLVLLMLFAWATYAVFTKKFVDVVPVALRTSSIGLQLPALADVKIRGVIVGDVREIESSGDGATLHLAIDPDKAERRSYLRLYEDYLKHHPDAPPEMTFADR